VKRFGRRGEALAIILVLTFAATVIGAILVKGRHDGLSLYPERAYPYQGKLMIGTNEVHEPKW
jgi:hypothetical protein